MMLLNRFVVFLFLWGELCVLILGDCSQMAACNGHGRCDNATSTCLCNPGWGAETDIATIKNPDCTARACPSGKAWADTPTSSTKAHALAECSGVGTCNPDTALCTCPPPYDGPACNRLRCPNDCSGHGVCVPMKVLARLSNALPLSLDEDNNNFYEGLDTTWDDDMIQGCVCDSSWAVGLNDGETQEAEWYGADCSKKRCPTGDNPKTTKDETNCYNVTAVGSLDKGQSGNKCHVDCSGQGICNDNGVCTCFTDYYGANCGSYKGATYNTINTAN